ncbi:hypothetical protein ACLESO_57280, partial [Pyxidicoccus sp. 3LG]
MFIRANAVTGAAGRFSANGQSGPDAPKDDGAGGGGAGGVISLRAVAGLGCSVAQARGGSGGSVTDASFLMGPGGGGSGGGVLMQGTSIACASSVSGGLPGTVAASDAGTYGAGSGGGGSTQQLSGGFRTPAVPTITAPVAGAVGVPSRPRFEGVAEPGVRVILFVDGVEVVQAGAGDDGRFVVSYPGLKDPLTAGEHTVTAVADFLGAYSARSTGVTFDVAVSLADGGVLLPPILVVPEDGEAVGPTPLFAGVAPNGPTVGIEVDNGPEVTLNVDEFGRFRYQWPAETPLSPGPHFVTVHVHNEAGETGPYSPVTRFESLEADAGTPDSGSPDAGSGETDAGSDAGSTGDAGTREVPVLVLPAEGEVVDSTPLFAGVAAPGASVSIEVDGAELVQVTADTTGAFRHLVTSEQALPAGAHSVTAHAVVSAAAGPRSPATGFEVRGPAN